MSSLSTRWPHDSRLLVFVLGTAFFGPLTMGCTFDPIAHVGESNTCGNATLDEGEVCDGRNLGGKTCESLGFQPGTLRCRSDCHGFITEACGTPPTCGNGVIESPETCDGTNLGGESCSSLGLGDGKLSCTASCRWDQSQCSGSSKACGNGTVEPPEQCDDGNGNDGDGCSSTCQVEFCGDGILQQGQGEECDDGNTNNGDGCSADCHSEYCGDGVTQTSQGEQCDDGNTNDGDGCSSTCQVEFCGDGVLQTNLDEECDTGSNNSDTTPDACRTDCTNPRCGDGVLDSDEQCDDGNSDDGDGCSADCHREYCGDGILQTNLDEECDGTVFSKTCEDYPWMGTGDPGCDANCQLDLAGCTNRPIGAPCTAASQCAGGRCIIDSNFPGGYCTKDCTDSSDCPGDAKCRQVTFVPGGTFEGCFDACTNAAECRTDYECYNNICLDTN